MDTNIINTILNKYWEGETSLEEEAILIEYFNQNEIDPLHLVYQPLFMAIDHDKKLQAPDGLQDRIMKQIEMTDNKPVYVIAMRRYVGVAASLLIIVFAGYFLLPTLTSQPKIDLYADTFDTPEEALEGILFALGTLSEKMNESTLLLEEEFGKLNHLNEFID